MPSGRRRPLAPRQQDREQYVVVNYVPSSTVIATDTTFVTNTTATQPDLASVGPYTDFVVRLSLMVHL